MSSKMLIDASRPEETRVVVVRGNRIEEFDYESKDRKQLKGNIYLARVTRVEPSLQAAFVEYGGNRQGFLAFSEIHPDYYQIPVADREALLAEEAAEARAEEAEHESGQKRGNRNVRRGKKPGGERVKPARSPDAATVSEPVAGMPDAEPVGFDDLEQFASLEPSENDLAEDGDDNGAMSDEELAAEEGIESVGEEDAFEEAVVQRRKSRRQYKIQEVIKRRQIMLVQVVKEERGNKGAALTTYMSLAGRYSVLMPNTARGGGISRKITSAGDRSRLKEIVSELDVPTGMGVILRTAGANRTRTEIKRDYDYLMRMWNNVRDLTLQSVAPALVYEEGNLIKRSIRDLYNKDISEVIVAGDEGYREAKDFMRMLMPSHAKVVQPYREGLPIFARNGIDAQLDKMLVPQVSLKSGGYLVINQTEALVSIDVNSGRSTREHSIEETALQTNLEAADEVARQLRLRDLAGLIVIDFIDMMENRNNRAVEKRLKDALKNDRARIQVGRISHFGLLEMSRQRIRQSVLESAMQPCPHCHGTGLVRSDNSFALHVVRMIEDQLLRDPRNHLIVKLAPHAALCVLNLQRRLVSDLETQFGLTITFVGDGSLGHDDVLIQRGEPANNEAALAKRAEEIAAAAAIAKQAALDEPDIEDIDEEDDEGEDAVSAEPEANDSREKGEKGDKDGRRNRRGRRRRGGRRENGESQAAGDTDAETSDAGEDDSEEPTNGESREDKRKRRRGRRGGRRRRRDGRPGYRTIPEAEPVGFTDDELAAFAAENDDDGEAEDQADGADDAVVMAEDDVAGEGAAAPTAEAASTAPVSAEMTEPMAKSEPAQTEPVAAEPETTTDDGKPRRRAPATLEASEPVLTSTASTEDANSKRKGWWRRGGFL